MTAVHYIKNGWITFLFVFLGIISSSALLSAPGEKARIAVIMSGEHEEYEQALQGFEKGLKDEKVDYELIRLSDVLNGNTDESVQMRITPENPDLILTLGSQATFYVEPYIKNIPIVFSMVLDPAATDTGNSNHRINGNVSGVTISIPVMKQFSIYKEFITRIRNIGVIYSPDENANLIREARQAAQKLGLNLIAVDITNVEEVPRALNNLIKIVDAFWMIPDKAVTSKEAVKHIIIEGFKNNIPILGLSEYSVIAGAAIAVSADYETVGMQSGKIASKILQGSKPFEIPVEFPQSVRIYVNERILDGIGIKVPDQSMKKAIKTFRE